MWKKKEKMRNTQWCLLATQDALIKVKHNESPAAFLSHLCPCTRRRVIIATLKICCQYLSMLSMVHQDQSGQKGSSDSCCGWTGSRGGTKTPSHQQANIGTMLQWYIPSTIVVGKFWQSLVQTQKLSINGTWNWRESPNKSQMQTGRMWKACLPRGLILFFLGVFWSARSTMIHQQSPWRMVTQGFHFMCLIQLMDLIGFWIILHVYSHLTVNLFLEFSRLYPMPAESPASSTCETLSVTHGFALFNPAAPSTHSCHSGKMMVTPIYDERIIVWFMSTSKL